MKLNVGVPLAAFPDGFLADIGAVHLVRTEAVCKPAGKISGAAPDIHYVP